MLRGSILEGNVSGRQIALQKDTLPIQIKLENNGQDTIKNITIPKVNTADITITSEKDWDIESLDAGESITLSGVVNINTNNNTNQLVLDITPQIKVREIFIPQTTLTHTITIAKPNININTYWQDGIEKIKPYETAKLVIDLKNIGNTALANTTIELPIPTSIIDVNKLIQLNNGAYKNGTFITNINNLGLNSEKQVILNIPIAYFPQGGTDLLLSLSPRLVGNLTNIPTSRYETDTETSNLKVGTQLLFKPEIRYYTDESDQLGRGPLPPQVGKETKYWALLNITNGTSKVSDIKLEGLLAPYATWTGKTSVSDGVSVSYNETTNIFSWNMNSLTPHQRAGVYFEIMITPTEEQVGTSPVLVKNTSVSATDTYINEQIFQSSQNLDITLTNDAIGRAKGTKVQ